MNRLEYLNDHRLVDSIIRKLPYNIQIKWAEELNKSAFKYKTLLDQASSTNIAATESNEQQR